MTANAVAFDETRYRTALGRFATGVCVVATGGGGAKITAMTINSFVSVSLQPPIVAWFLGNQSQNFAAFADAPAFGISVLGAEAEPLARHFADPARGAVGPDPFIDARGCAPILGQAVAAFVCDIVRRDPIGDHLALYGAVREFSIRPGAGAALGFFGGRFHRFPTAGDAAAVPSTMED